MTTENEHKQHNPEKEPGLKITPGTVIFMPQHGIGSHIYIVTEVERDSDDEDYCSFVELNDEPNLRTYGWQGGAKVKSIGTILGQEPVELATKALEYSYLIKPPVETEEATYILEKYRALLVDEDL